MKVLQVTPTAVFHILPYPFPAGQPTPPNGNPGIVPPWLTKAVDTNVIGINPVDPDVPHIM
jgi:hypothetical protein